MKKLNRHLQPANLAADKVLAWWDIDLYIGAFTKRKMTARPLRELERVLGHRLHVEDWSRFEAMPPGVWKFQAYTYLDTTDPALAAFNVLMQLRRVSSWVSTSQHGLNANATLSNDWDGSTITALYWAPPDQIDLSRYVSSGVMLILVSSADQFPDDDHNSRRCRQARPIVPVTEAPQQRADYTVEIEVRIICGNKQDLMRFHWPKFQASHWPEGVDQFDVDAKTHSGKPNIIIVRKILRNIREHEAVAYCLALAPSLRCKLDPGEAFRFAGERLSGAPYSDGIVGFVATRIVFRPPQNTR